MKRYAAICVLVLAGFSLFAPFSIAKDPPATSPANDQLALQASVSKNGITWTFAQPARVGQFINGDFYVVGPVTVLSIDPKPLFGDEVKTAPADEGNSKESHFPGQFARNGSTLNLPAVVPPSKLTTRTRRSGFDSRMPMDAYDPDQFTKLPIAMKPGDSLVSSISAEPMERGYPIKAVAILTCVAEPQPADAFRPSYCQSATGKQYLARNLHREKLLALPLPAGAEKVKLSWYVDALRDPWIDTVGFGRAMPRKSFQFYGPNIAEIGGESTLLLLLNLPAKEKEPLLINLVQIGIDLHGLVRGGGGWPAEGGGDAGRKWPIVFSGLLLDDPAMYDLTQSYPAAGFHEDEQTAFCPVVFNGKKFDHTWSGAKVVWTGHYGFANGKFRSDGRPLNDYGPVDLLAPAEWAKPWSVGSEGYRRATTSPAWVAEALAARLMHAEKAWNHDAFFAYVDRWMTEDDAPAVAAMLKNVDDKIAAATAPEEKKSLETARAAITAANRGGTITGKADMIPVVKELWSTYRNHLPDDRANTPPAESTWK